MSKLREQLEHSLALEIDRADARRFRNLIGLLSGPRLLDTAKQLSECTTLDEWRETMDKIWSDR